MYTVRMLHDALAFAKAHPEGIIRAPGMDWAKPTYTGAEWCVWFRQRLDTKINREQPPVRGRKDCRDWFIQRWRLCRDLNTPRLVIDWLPGDLKTRFAHRLRGHGDSL